MVLQGKTLCQSVMMVSQLYDDGCIKLDSRSIS